MTCKKPYIIRVFLCNMYIYIHNINILIYCLPIFIYIYNVRIYVINKMRFKKYTYALNNY